MSDGLPPWLRADPLAEILWADGWSQVVIDLAIERAAMLGYVAGGPVLAPLVLAMAGIIHLVPEPLRRRPADRYEIVG